MPSVRGVVTTCRRRDRDRDRRRCNSNRRRVGAVTAVNVGWEHRNRRRQVAGDRSRLHVFGRGNDRANARNDARDGAGRFRAVVHVSAIRFPPPDSTYAIDEIWEATALVAGVEASSPSEGAGTSAVQSGPVIALASPGPSWIGLQPGSFSTTPVSLAKADLAAQVEISASSFTFSAPKHSLIWSSPHPHPQLQ